MASPSTSRRSLDRQPWRRPGPGSATSSRPARGRRCSGRGSGAGRPPLERHQPAAVDHHAAAGVDHLGRAPHLDGDRVGTTSEADHAAGGDRAPPPPSTCTHRAAVRRRRRRWPAGTLRRGAGAAKWARRRSRHPRYKKSEEEATPISHEETVPDRKLTRRLRCWALQAPGPTEIRRRRPAWPAAAAGAVAVVAGVTVWTAVASPAPLSGSPVEHELTDRLGRIRGADRGSGGLPRRPTPTRSWPGVRRPASWRRRRPWSRTGPPSSWPARSSSAATRGPTRRRRGRWCATCTSRASASPTRGGQRAGAGHHGGGQRGGRRRRPVLPGGGRGRPGGWPGRPPARRRHGLPGLRRGGRGDRRRPRYGGAGGHRCGPVDGPGSRPSWASPGSSLPSPTSRSARPTPRSGAGRPPRTPPSPPRPPPPQ